MINKLLSKIKKTIEGLENPSIPFSYIVFTFIVVTTLRNFIEEIVFEDSLAEDLMINFYHYYLSYICLALIFVAILCLATRQKVQKVARVVLPSFIVLNLTPLIDMFFLRSRSYTLGYMFPFHHKNMLMRFFTFFGPWDKSGITPGMRIEIAIVLAAIFIYLSVKKVKLVNKVFIVLLSYATIFAYCALPFCIQLFMKLFGATSQVSSLKAAQFYLLLIFSLSCFLYYWEKRSYFIELVKDMRWLRLLHFELMFLLGLILLTHIDKNQFVLTEAFILQALLVTISIALAWLYSVTTNNISDISIDMITSPQRPTVTKQIPLDHYHRLTWFFLAGALIYSASVCFEAFLLMLLFIGNYFVYSMPPFRLKRIPFLSKFIIVFNSILLIMLGCFLYTKEFEMLIVNGFFFM